MTTHKFNNRQSLINANMLNKTTLAACCLGLAAGASAGGFYISGSYGVSELDDVDNMGTFTSAFTTGEVTGVSPPLTVPAGSPVGWDTELDSGEAYSFALGMGFNEFRLELEYAVSDTDIDTHQGVSAAGIPLGTIDAGVLLSGNVGDLGISVADLVADGRGEVDSETYFLNLYYDIDTGTGFTPFLGMGVGMTNVEVSYQPSGVMVIDDDDDVLSYQFLAGVGYDFNEHVTLSLAFKYRDSQEATVESSLLPARFDLDMEGYVYDLGLRYTF
ncbi:porin family protein [Aestuariicella hydrocarbonica]|uniref:Porin family protein n=1 Tax=Pseudomaricurvus hydrocarbonicus TaxID=1470433 RepID=A0A9E5JXS7_9GAMM|nr:outer membrane beta-barrel protein [Aestuariicella hydrocarbonica]NHO66510.1 porin family protein [Aestuariicella hydrocarbonica]